MAVSDSAVKQRIDQILQERGNTPEAYAQIAKEAREAGVSALQVDRALDNELTEADIRRAAAEAGGAFGITDLASRVQSGDLTREQAESLMQANIASPLSAEAFNLKYNPTTGAVEPVVDSASNVVSDSTVSDSGSVSPAAPTSMFDTSLDYMKFAAEGTKELAGYTPETVTAGTMPSVDISQYMNPYTQEVIDRSLADIERQRLMQQQQTSAQAQAAGAFGGSRQGVAQALTNEAFARQAAQTSANLRQQGFGQATGLAQSDLNRQLQAQQLNQAAGLQGAGFQLGAQSQLGNMGLTGYNLAQQQMDQFMANEAMKQGMQTGLYGQQIGQVQSFFGQPAQALGYVPAAISGLPYSQTTTGTQQPGTFDYLTLGAYAAPTLMKLSDQQLKTDIKEIKTLDNGIKVVSWKWNQIGKKIADPNQPTIGVIAQQIAKIIPEAVKRHASGYLMVDYSHPELRGV